ncbi:capsular biosynthesis protein [Ralstonia sp. GX3-BWBA]|uniref:capsular polysaccharide export protein, LipB/KpsS family n=1 Tax=Ralstonia sp. GX3-BWBA TaxID=2219865 RepID=UPI000DD4B239|nr:capsular biosynthesis protein [Ralstonia sp. GX3-BWBA]
MRDMGAVAGPVPQVASYLRGVTRGWRTLGSIAGVAGGVWGERRVGRAVLRLKRCIDSTTPTLLPGPIWSECKLGEPMLSWFVLPGPGGAGDPMEQAVQGLLASVDSLGTSPELPDLMARMVAARADLARNATPVCPPELMQPHSKPRVLLIDQQCGWGATRAAFARMVAAAQSEHPGAEIWIWPAARGAAGGLSGAGDLPTGTRRIAAGFSFFATLSHIDHTYTVSAPEGMQALLAGIPVRVFGRPYYAGWGLTTDDLPMPDRHHRPTLAALFDAVYLRLARYLDPETHGVGTLERSLDSIELQRTVRARYADCERVAGVRFQLWKRFFATPFLMAGGSKLRWARVSEKIEHGERVALWGGKSTEGIPASAPMLRMEDGFFHSDGLGSDMNAPCSQVLDREGLYFDARTPNELTHTLNSAQFDDAELARAAALRELIARLGVTKYNLGRRAPGWNAPAGKTVILVAGQVADDASIRFGTGALGTAEALLEAVRKRNPDGFIVYKPHPDVLSGNRQGLVHAHELADIVDAESDVVSLVDCADEVHVLSSLVGFDALLRGKRVFTYGLPFYAGWGLTQDALEQPWRQRKLTLDMLVAGALLRYPIYWDWRTRLFTTPEAVVRKLGSTAARPLGRIADDWKRPLRKAWRWSRNAAWYGYWAWAQRRQARLRGVL